MLPFLFEWQWDLGHFIFFGLFYLALAVVGGGLGYCMFMTIKDMFTGEFMHQHHGDESGGEGH